MNTTLTLDSTSAIPQAGATKAGFYERLVLQSFKPFVHGGMRMTWPDGRARVWRAWRGDHAEMRIRSMEFFKRCALFGNVGFGEAYVDGDWDTDSIADVISWFILNLSKTQGSRSLLGQSGVREPAQRREPHPAPAAAEQRHHQPPQHRGALRPRKRLLLALARRDHDLLRRAL
jgi:hypothetical protein